MSSLLAQLLSQPSLEERAPHAFAPGAEWFRMGRVTAFSLLPELAEASVLGTGLFRVSLRVRDGALSHTCSCPSGLQGLFCEHCVAVALQIREEPLEPASESASDSKRTQFEQDAAKFPSDSRHLRMGG